MTTFETGKTYYYRFACNTDTVVKCTITKRTAKTITFKEDDGEVKTRRGGFCTQKEKFAFF